MSIPFFTPPDISIAHDKLNEHKACSRAWAQYVKKYFGEPITNQFGNLIISREQPHLDAFDYNLLNITEPLDYLKFKSWLYLIRENLYIRAKDIEASAKNTGIYMRRLYELSNKDSFISNRLFSEHGITVDRDIELFFVASLPAGHPIDAYYLNPRSRLCNLISNACEFKNQDALAVVAKCVYTPEYADLYPYFSVNSYTSGIWGTNEQLLSKIKTWFPNKTDQLAALISILHVYKNEASADPELYAMPSMITDLELLFETIFPDAFERYKTIMKLGLIESATDICNTVLNSGKTSIPETELKINY